MLVDKLFINSCDQVYVLRNVQYDDEDQTVVRDWQRLKDGTHAVSMVIKDGKITHLILETESNGD